MLSVTPHDSVGDGSFAVHVYNPSGPFAVKLYDTAGALFPLHPINPAGSAIANTAVATTTTAMANALDRIHRSPFLT